MHEIDPPAEPAAVPAEESTDIATMPTDPAEVFSAEEAAAPRPSALRNAFFGADGLRAGWGLLLFIAILAASTAAVQWTQHAIRHRHAAQAASSTASPAKSSGKSGSTAADAARESKPMPPRAAILGEGSSFLVVLFATFLMSRIERRRFGAFGLGGTNRLRQFLAGLFWGLVCLSLLVGVLRWGGYLRFDARLLSAVAALRYGALWAVGFLFVALLEETMLRGYAQYTLARGLAGIYGAIFKGTRHRHALGFWTAALLLSFVFGLGHSSNPGESPIGLLGAGLAGLVFCFAIYRTGSLWWAIGLHASWDWAQSFLYGVADSGLMVEGRLFATQPVGKPLLSGGLTGPEGSIFAVVTLMMIAGIILVTLRQTHRPGEGLSHPDGD